MVLAPEHPLVAELTTPDHKAEVEAYVRKAQSTTEIDRRYAAAETARKVSAPSPSSTACIGEDGAWKNWPWPNVPALSPKCGQNR